jgi:hypothetical protein
VTLECLESNFRAQPTRSLNPDRGTANERVASRRLLDPVTRIWCALAKTGSDFARAFGASFV